MNPVERAARWVDARQQRYTPLAFAIGVVKKYGDDNGGVLVANLAYSCFISLFPLLLVLVTIVGLVAASDPAFRTAVHTAVASQLPLIGQQLTGNVHQLRRSSVIGLIAALAAAVWGSTGLAQAGLFTMEQVWNLPGPARPGYVPRLGRAVEFLGVLGVGVIVTTLLASLGTYGHHGALVVALAAAAAVAANVGMYVVAGAVAGAVAWTLLQVLGSYLVHHFEHSGSVYGVFAIVLGLAGWIYLGAEVTVYAAEINVVLTRKLWPRAIVQPPLTEPDRAPVQGTPGCRTFSRPPGKTASPAPIVRHRSAP